MKLGEIFYSIGADAKEALQKFKEAEEAAKKTAQKIEDSMKLDNLGEGAKKSTEELKKSLDGVGKSGEKASSETQSALQKIGTKASELASTIKMHAMAMGQAIITHLQATVAPAVQAFNKIGNAASKLTEQVGNAMSNVGQTLTNKITKPAVAVAGALGGATIFGGFKRLTALDNAQSKLRGIGYEGQQLNNIMTSATEAVAGTVFATADAADVASMALASGVKEGKDLDNYLSNVVNTASYMQAPLSEVAQIFNKVQAEGKLSGDVVSQMAARSVSAVDILADRLGKTPEEIRKMVTEGKISFEDFSNAIGDYMGSAAAEMGGTFTGLMMNLSSRLGILGEKFLGVWSEGSGAYYIMKEELQKLVDFLPSLYDEAEKLGRAFTPIVQSWVDSFHKFKDTFLALDSDVKKRVVGLVASFAGLAVGIGPFLKISGAMLTAGGKMGQMFTGLGQSVFKFGGALAGAKGAGALKIFAGTMAQTVGTFSLAIAGFGALAVAIGGVAAIIGLLPEQFREDLTTMLEIVDETLPMLSEKLTTFFTENLPQAVSDGLSTLGEVFSTMGNVFDSMGEVATSLLEGLIEGFKQNEGQWAVAAISMITSLGTALVTNVGELLRLGALFVAQLGQGIAENSDEIVAYLPILINEIANFFGSEEFGALADAGVALVRSLAISIWENRELIFEAFINLVQGAFEMAMENWRAILFAAGVYIVKTLVTAIIGVKGLLIAVGVMFVVWLVSKIDWGALMDAGIKMVTKIRDGIQSLKNMFVNKGRELVEGFRSKASSVSLSGVGRNIINGLWNGMKSIWGSVASWFSAKMNWLRNAANSILSIRSPSRVFMEIGEFVMKGLGIGMEDEFKDVQKILTRSIHAIINMFDKFELPSKELDLSATGDMVTRLTARDELPELEEERARQAYMMELQEEMVFLLRKLLQKNTDLIINGRVLSEEILDDINHLNDLYANRGTRIRGGAAHP